MDNSGDGGSSDSTIKLDSLPFTLCISGALALMFGLLIVNDQIDVLYYYNYVSSSSSSSSVSPDMFLVDSANKLAVNVDVKDDIEQNSFVSPVDFFYKKAPNFTKYGGSSGKPEYINERLAGARYIGYALMVIGWILICVSTIFSPSSKSDGRTGGVGMSMEKGIGLGLYILAGILFTLLFTVLAYTTRSWLYGIVLMSFFLSLAFGSILISFDEDSSGDISLNGDRFVLLLMATVILMVAIALSLSDRRCCNQIKWAHTFTLSTPLMCFAFMMISFGVSIDS